MGNVIIATISSLVYVACRIGPDDQVTGWVLMGALMWWAIGYGLGIAGEWLQRKMSRS